MNDTVSTPRITEVACPTCRQTVPWTEASPWRPFCSEKCQLIDFGEWASERHSIPGDTGPDELSFPAPEDQP